MRSTRCLPHVVLRPKGHRSAFLHLFAWLPFLCIYPQCFSPGVASSYSSFSWCAQAIKHRPVADTNHLRTSPTLRTNVLSPIFVRPSCRWVRRTSASRAGAHRAAQRMCLCLSPWGCVCLCLAVCLCLCLSPSSERGRAQTPIWASGVRRDRNPNSRR